MMRGTANPERSHARGAAICALYRGCWRPSADVVPLTLAQLVGELPNLIESGGVGLIWPRVRDGIASDSAIAQALQVAYESQQRHNRLVAGEIAKVVTRLRAAGIEPVLVKGWAISRLYPEPLVRPAGDIDLWVPLAEAQRTRQLLSDPHDPMSVDIDIQHRAPHLQYSWLNSNQKELAAATEVIPVLGVPVRTPCPEDHLRMLCLHFLGHGALRPLWLCDVALMVEARTSQFDWERCLGANTRQRGWIITTLRLAHVLLGADIADTPASAAGDPLPNWLITAVLKRWELGSVSLPQNALASVVREPKRLWVELGRRWPDPITATVQMNMPYSSLPRWPIQASAFASRLGLYGVWRFPEQALSVLPTRRSRLRIDSPDEQLPSLSSPGCED